MDSFGALDKVHNRKENSYEEYNDWGGFGRLEKLGLCVVIGGGGD